jgi:hypothetical protein
MNGPSWKLEDDLVTITITFPTTPPVSIAWSASIVDEVLQNLGNLRAHMTPAFSESWTLGQTVFAISNPGWTTEPDALLGNTLLHIRDPRFGWLHYMLPRHEARKLADALQDQVNAPPPGQAQEGKA